MPAQTEEDLKKKWKANLGEEKGDYYHHFWHELHHLRLIWSELRTVIRQDKEGKKILSDTIPIFCRVVTDSMWRNMIIGLCCFSDEPPIKRKTPKPWKRPLLGLLGYSHLYAVERPKLKSFSFPYWLSDHTDNLDDQQKQDLQDVINTYKSHLGPIKQARNKYLGHWTANAKERLLAKPVRQEFIERTLKDVEVVLNEIERQNGMTRWVMEDGPAPLGGAEDLLRYLSTAQDNLFEEDRKGAELREKNRIEREARITGLAEYRKAHV